MGNLSIDSWDFIAVIIAFCSFCVAICSFCVALRSYFIAKKTLTSQQQTEKNTTPLMDEGVQNFLMKENLYQIYDAFNNLNALKSVLDKCHYKSFPFSGIQNDLEISPDFIHIEIFYSQVNTFHAFKGFINAIRQYNSKLSYFFESLRNQELHESHYSIMMDNFIDSVNRMVHYWMIIMKKCYSMNENELSALMDNMTGLFKYEDFDKDIICIIEKKNTNFIKFYSKDEDQDRLIKIMNCRVKEGVDEYSKLLINYERNRQ